MSSPGTSIGFGDDRYEFVRELGHGTFGAVYEVLDRRRGGVVALKLLRRADAESLYRFKREFRLLADTTHPNLVQLYELGVEADAWHLTMELVRGQDFNGFVRRPGAAASSDLARLREALRQLVAGVGALHARGILHRDLKPSNVLVTPSGRAVVLDFGMALQLSTETGPRLCGTPAYMAPECSRSEWSTASDWYALGVMLYEALSGERPLDVRELWDLPRKFTTPVPSLPEQAWSEAPDLAQLCMELLDAEAAARPGGDQIAQRLARVRTPQAAAVSPLSPNRLPLLGREPELDALRTAFRRARGHTVLVTIRGVSGIGKTALIGDFLDWAGRRPTAAVLAGRCYQQESIPYKALDAWMDALSEHLLQHSQDSVGGLLPAGAEVLTRLFPVLGRNAGFPEGVVDRDASPVEVRRRAAEVLHRLLHNLAAGSPVVLALDDAQWADADSVALLRRAVEGAQPLSLLLVLVVRDDAQESPSVLAPLIETVRGVGGELVAIALGPLPADQSEAMVRAQLGAQVAPKLVERLVTEGQGIPFFLEMLSSSVRNMDAGGHQGQLDHVLGDALQRLPLASARLLELLAVAGRPLPEGIACEAAFDAGTSVLASLRAQRLLRVTGPGGAELDLYHDRIRQAILNGMDRAAQRYQHQRLATVLERATPTDHEALFTHFDAAGDEAAAARHGLRAAEIAASKLAFVRAATIYERLLALGVLDPAQRPSLRAERARMLAFAGHGLDAARIYERLADTAATSGEALKFNRLAGEQLLMAGHVDEGFRRLKTVLAAYGMRMPQTPVGAIASLLWQRLRLRVHGLNFRLRRTEEVPAALLEQLDSAMAIGRGLAIIDTIRGASFQTLCTRLALQSGERSRVAQALTMEIGYAAAYGSAGVERARRLHAMATALVDADDAAARGTLLLGTGMIHHVGEGRFPEALAALDQAEALLVQASGTAWELDTLRLLATDALLYSGQLRELKRRAPIYLRDALERGDRYLSSSMQMGSGHHRWLVDGQPEDLRTEVREALRLWSQTGFSWQQWWALWALAQADLYQGRAIDAWARLRAGWPGLRASQLQAVQMVAVESLHLRARAHLAAAQERQGSQRAEPLAQAEACARKTERLGCAWSLPLAAMIRAGVSHTRGDADDARQTLERAVAVLAAHGPGLHLPAARWQLGALQGGDGGKALIEVARGALVDQGVRDPAAMVRMLAPGFGE